MAKPKKNPFARTRIVLVSVFIGLAIASFACAFALAWHKCDGVYLFLATSIVFALWATITATVEKPNVTELLGVLRFIRNSPDDW